MKGILAIDNNWLFSNKVEFIEMPLSMNNEFSWHIRKLRQNKDLNI